MKRDLKSAFRYIPVSPLDYRLLNFAWNAIFYVDKFLPVGLRTAFEYDFLFVFPPDTETAICPVNMTTY